MKFIKQTSALALLMATSFAVAQTANDQKANPPTGNEDSEHGKTDQINSQDHKTGNDLSANKANGKSSNDSAPGNTGAINSQGSGSGNNLMGNNKGVHGTTAFDTLDTGHTGMVTKAQGMKDPWLAKNFANCDLIPATMGTVDLTWLIVTTSALALPFESTIAWSAMSCPARL